MVVRFFFDLEEVIRKEIESRTARTSGKTDMVVKREELMGLQGARPMNLPAPLESTRLLLLLAYPHPPPVDAPQALATN
ncbi:hypothetical protein KIN20_005118 [Parelaphostrongylus tenuis]|uniref:Uncharacterized protein n=1 Tax=Parelaphostrongylus tenuis TaxID=148309 RepID=A0AAD5MSC0_PARTN|nr:hypothetical protein KIN20_005118 [Parelaphostrongylus tenuis]